MTDQNCAYCMEGDLVAAFGIKICELPSSKVYLFKEQSHKGRVIVAHKKHVSEITELTAEERAAYIEDINHVMAIPVITCTSTSFRSIQTSMSGAASSL